MDSHNLKNFQVLITRSYKHSGRNTCVPTIFFQHQMLKSFNNRSRSLSQMIDNPLFRCSISLHCIILVEPFHMTCLFFRALCPLSPATDIHGSRRNLFTFEVNDLQTFAVQLFTLGSKLDDYFLFKTNSAPKTSHKSLSATFSRKAD